MKTCLVVPCYNEAQRFPQETFLSFLAQHPDLASQLAQLLQLVRRQPRPLARIHLLAIRMVGALEWTFPIAADTERARATIEGNYLQLLRWIDSGALVVDELGIE